MAANVLSVSQINEHIRQLVDSDRLLANVAVSGEISNYKMYPSGHHYFTLKDENAALKCVMFKTSAQKLRFRPENGMKVICLGRISVYPRDGAYQLYCTGLVLDGVGDLHAAFEQLKAKLLAQGLFDPAHKKPLPKYPGTIVIITSSAGAAVHDMLRILRKRYPLSKVRLLPVRVQGVEAPGEIASAIEYANYFRLGDLIITGRGGGSMEDLWAFNDEHLAHVIYNSRIPVISAVGHEPDVTISDYVADLRAATPSNAAELAVPDQNGLRQTMDAMQETMATVLSRQIRNARAHLTTLSGSQVLRSPENYLKQKRLVLEHLQKNLVSAQTQQLTRKEKRFGALTASLDAMSPLKVLSRGYAMAQTADGTLLRSSNQVRCQDELTISLADGEIRAAVTEVKERSL